MTHIGAELSTTVQAYLARPLVALAMLALVLSASIHMRIGLKEIIEDYVHGEGAKVVAILLGAPSSLSASRSPARFAIVKISLGSLSTLMPQDATPARQRAQRQRPHLSDSTTTPTTWW